MGCTESKHSSGRLALVLNWLIILLLLCLPILEAPKNLLSLFLLITAVFYCFKNRLGGEKNYALLLCLWMLFGIFSSLNAYINYGYSASGALDLFRFASVGIAVSLISFSVKDELNFAAAAIFGCLIALALAFWNYLNGSIDFISLKSVGHVNHSALYLLMSLCVAMPLLVFAKLNPLLRILLLIAVGCLVLGILYTNSRAAVGATAFIFFCVLCFMCYARKWRMVLAGGALIAFVAIIAGDQLQKIGAKQHSWLKGHLTELDYSRTPRGQINQVSKFVLTEYPVLGIGLSNFSYVSKNIVPALAETGGKELQVNPGLLGLHPHNLYYDQLTATGMTGFFVFLVFWGYVIRQLWLTRNCILHRTAPEGPDWRWIVVAMLIVAHAGAGLFNTTFHHEVALLTIIVISVLLPGLAREHRQPS